MYKNIIEVCCEQPLHWNRSISENWWQKVSFEWKKTCIILLSEQYKTFGFLKVHFHREIKLCQQQKVAELNYFVCHAANTSTASIHFVIHSLVFVSRRQTYRNLPHTVHVIWLSYGKYGLPYNILWSKLFCIKLIHKNLICINGVERLMIS